MSCACPPPPERRRATPTMCPACSDGEYYGGAEQLADKLKSLANTPIGYAELKFVRCQHSSLVLTMAGPAENHTRNFWRIAFRSRYEDGLAAVSLSPSAFFCKIGSHASVRKLAPPPPKRKTDMPPFSFVV